MKKFVSMLLALAMSLALCVPAFAAEVEEPSECEASVSVQPRAASIPTEKHDLPYSATVTNLSEGTGTYTKYYFAPSGTDIEISGTLRAVKDQNDKSRYAIIYLYKVGDSSSVDSYTVDQFLESTSFSHTFTNLSSSSHYYLDIRNTTSNNIQQQRWISGTVEIK